MDAATWVDLAPLVDPTRAWLHTATGQVVTFARAPKGDAPPFSVLQIVSDPRLILTLDGGLPVELTWQVDYLGTTPVQALALADKGTRAMVFGDPPELPRATIAWRDAVGDTHGPDKVKDDRFVVQARYRWTLIGAAVVDA